MATKVDRRDWQEFAQPWEVGWWMQQFAAGTKTAGKHRAESVILCERLGITPDLIHNRALLDVGCGPTGRLSSLILHKGSGHWMALDPLVELYRRMPDAILDGYDTLIAKPAEDSQPELLSAFDVIVSINALDHGADLGSALAVLYSYLRPYGIAIISFDCFEGFPDVTHPIRVSYQEADALVRSAGFIIDDCDNEIVLGDRCNWGRGQHWHWWLSREGTW